MIDWIFDLVFWAGFFVGGCVFGLVVYWLCDDADSENNPIWRRERRSFFNRLYNSQNQD